MSSAPPQLPSRYLKATGLPERWQRLESFVILDTVFACGRFTAVCEAFEQSPGVCKRLFYLSVCPHGQDASKPPAVASPSGSRFAEELSKQWPAPLPGFHPINLLQGRVQLCLALGSPETQVPLFDALCDALLVDGRWPVAPSALARLAGEDSVILLRDACGEQADALREAGFLLSPAPEPDTFDGTFRARKRTATPRNSLPLHGETRRALVIGAGVAGTAIAAALAARDWQVSLLEREPEPAAGASGNLAAVFSPLLSMDDGRAARLSRACFLHLLRELQSHTAASRPVLWRSCGVLQLPKSQKEESHFRALVARHGYPENYVRFVEKPAAQQLLGQPLPGGGWFFEQGGWVNPPSLCAARISAHPFRICAQFGKDIQQLKHDGDEWIALGPTGEPLGRAPVVILANAWEASRLLAAPGLPFKRVRGQVAHLASGCIPPVDCVLSMDGYLTPTVQGMHCLGATYDFGSNELALDPDAHLQNIHRLTQMLPEAPLPLPAPPHGRVGFRTLTPDRMPIVGALPEALLSAMSHPASGSGGTPGSLGLYCFVGLGSRGVVWSALLGEYLAALLDGTPSPLPLDLARPLKPERFLKMHFSGRESG